MINIILDSYALLTFYSNESGSVKVRTLIHQAASGKLRLLMSVINLGEIWYIVKRRISISDADRTIEELHQMNIEVIDTDWQQTRQAALYKSRGNISYADCFAAALAKIHNADLVTGDPEFKSLENEISISWL